MIKYGTKPAPIHNKAELDKKIAKAHQRHDKYRILLSYNFAEFLTELEELKSAGYTIDPDFVPMLYPLETACQLQLRLIKPVKTIKAELADLTAQVTADYAAEIEAETQRCVELMAIRLVSEAEEKATKQAEADRLNKLATARIQAAEILGVSQ